MQAKESSISKEDVERGAMILARFCGQVRPGDRALIIVDDTTEEVGKQIFKAAKELTRHVMLIKTKTEGMHGAEPLPDVAAAMLDADIIFGATKSSMAHTEARKNASGNGARYLSLPDYSLAQLASKALTVDFIAWTRKARRVKELLDKAERIEITTRKGTDLRLECAGRTANFCPGFCGRPGTLGSPPDIETNIPPLEEKSEGEIIVDGSIPCSEIGVIREDIPIKIKNGMIAEISETSVHAQALKGIFEMQGKNARVLAEFGVGLNPAAQLCGRMLEDEGCLGTVHFGFGSNSTIGGLNKINFHLDFVIRNPTVRVDGFVMIEEGKLRI